MLFLEKSSLNLITIEEAIINSDINFNVLSKNKEILTIDEIIQEIKSGASIGAKRFLVKEDEEYIGILEYLPINPSDQTTWLGLLLIKNEHQTKGFGTQVLNLFEEKLVRQDVKKYRIGVIKENEKAHKFWSRQGFNRINQVTNEDGKEVIIYEKNL
jgi:RimJ/RimL family protein N-acetyltransferase